MCEILDFLNQRCNSLKLEENVPRSDSESIYRLNYIVNSCFTAHDIEMNCPFYTQLLNVEVLVNIVSCNKYCVALFYSN